MAAAAGAAAVAALGADAADVAAGVADAAAVENHLHHLAARRGDFPDVEVGEYMRPDSRDDEL